MTDYYVPGITEEIYRDMAQGLPALYGQRRSIWQRIRHPRGRPCGPLIKARRVADLIKYISNETGKKTVEWAIPGDYIVFTSSSDMECLIKKHEFERRFEFIGALK